MATIETRYAFTFVRPDGSVYERHIYWETLYALLTPSGQVLAARRAVPLNDTMFAFYVSLRETIRDSTERKLLAGPDAEDTSQELPAEGGADIVPYRFSEVLALALREEKDVPSMTVRQLAAEYSSIVPTAAVPAEFQPYVAAPVVGVGKLRELPLPPIPIVPPVLTGFLLARYERLGEIVSLYEEEEGVDSRFHAERMASLVGRAEASALGTARHFEVVVLGRVVEGEVPVNQKDPEASRHSYQVDPEAHLGGVVLKEISGSLERSRARLLARWGLHGNIKRVRFVGEL